MARSSVSFRSVILCGALGLAVGIAFAAAAIPTISPSSDLWEYAQEARQIARGQGFTSLYTYPVFLGREGPPFPVLWRMPLYPSLGAFLLWLGVRLPDGFLYFGALAHALLVALTYWLAGRLHSARAGAIAAACAVACPFFLDPYNPGLSQVPAAVLGLAVWLALVSSRGRLGAAVAALPAAAVWLLRAESMVFIPAWIWMAAMPDGSSPRRWRWTRALSFLAVYAALCLPWLIVMEGERTGFGLPARLMLLYTPQYPGYSSWRMVGAALPGALEYVAQHPAYAVLRYARNVAGYLLTLLSGVGPVALAIAVAGVAARRRLPSLGLAAPAMPLLLAIALQIFSLAAVQHAPRFLTPIAPLACVLVGMAATPLLDRWGGGRRAAALLLALALERAGTVAYQRVDAGRRGRPLGRETVSVLVDRTRNWSRDRGVLLTDVPDWAAWHLDRPTIFLPLRGDVEKVTQARPVSGIWLSRDARARNLADRDSAWVLAIDRNEPLPGFAGPDVLPDGSRLYRHVPRE